MTPEFHFRKSLENALLENKVKHERKIGDSQNRGGKLEEQ